MFRKLGFVLATLIVASYGLAAIAAATMIPHHDQPQLHSDQTVQLVKGKDDEGPG